MPNNKIPIVFAFDDNYALPASIAIQSLIDAKHPDTEYDVFVMHGGLKKSTMRKMEKICPIKWIYVDKTVLGSVPVGWSGLETYYRLLVAKLIPNYDKIVWSDVDVLFRGDLSKIYNAPLNDADWAGVAAECRDEKNGIHNHFAENTNDFIYMPGFMIINAKKWRGENKLDEFFKTISKFASRLKFFDLDILNLACKNIKPVPFEYCVLENIYDSDDITQAPEYPWLSRVHSHDKLMRAKQNPLIIHYAGKWPKIWNMPTAQIPQYYMDYIKSSPFYVSEHYYPTWRTSIRRAWLWILIKLCPVKSWRQKMKRIKKELNDL